MRITALSGTEHGNGAHLTHRYDTLNFLLCILTELQVVVAPIREEFDCGPQYGQDCPAAYDGLHPNELGEYQVSERSSNPRRGPQLRPHKIARAFTRALVHGLGIGNAPLEVPGQIPARPLPIPASLQIFESPVGLTATWDKGKMPCLCFADLIVGTNLASLRGVSV
jgi:hypothetical protein